MMVAHTKSLQAMEAQRSELDRKAAEISENEERLRSLQQEVTNRNNDLQKTRTQIEALVNKSAEMEERRLKQLAGVYASMRAEEAAPILYTLKNDLIVRIIEKISDNRQKAKLMAAFGNIDKERAGEISRRMGEAPMQKKASKGKGNNS
jgi:flagellar motility protein MotE (MotC chaperone)